MREEALKTKWKRKLKQDKLLADERTIACNLHFGLKCFQRDL